MVITGSSGSVSALSTAGDEVSSMHPCQYQCCLDPNTLYQPYDSSTTSGVSHRSQQRERYEIFPQTYPVVSMSNVFLINACLHLCATC